MSDVIEAVAGLSPAEEAFFSSGGTADVPAGEQAAEPEKKEETSEAPATEAADKSGGEEGEPKLVTVKALHEERNRRREAQEKAREYEKKIAEFQGKFSVIERLYGKDASADKPAAPPKPEEDIFAAVNHQGQTLEQIQQKLNAQEEARKQEEAKASFVAQYQAEANKFEASTPDFREAYNFLLQSRAKELVAIGYDNPKEIADALQADELAIAQRAFQLGKSPAEMLYSLAKERGYAKKAPADTKPPAVEKLEKIEQGQAANKSLSSTGGGAGEGEMTADMLIKMPMDEFESWCEKNPAKARRILGG